MFVVDPDIFVEDLDFVVVRWKGCGGREHCRSCMKTFVVVPEMFVVPLKFFMLKWKPFVVDPETFVVSLKSVLVG